MTKAIRFKTGVIASQISFTRMPAPCTFQFHFQGQAYGEVKVVNGKWIVVDENVQGETREEVVAKYLVANNLFVNKGAMK